MFDEKKNLGDHENSNTSTAEKDSNGLSRRDAIGIGATFGVYTLMSVMLEGCRTRGFSAGPRKSGTLSNFFSDDFFKHYEQIANDPIGDGSTPGPYGDTYIRGFGLVAYDAASSNKVTVTYEKDASGAIVQFNGIPADKLDPLEVLKQDLFRALILYRIKDNPVGSVWENMKLKPPKGTVEGYVPGKILVPAAYVKDPDLLKIPSLLAPVLVLSHAGVVGQVLDPDAVIANPVQFPVQRDSLTIAAGTEVNRYRLLGYHPEMPHLTGHYILCDDDVKRHDSEKMLQLTHALPEKVYPSIVNAKFDGALPAAGTPEATKGEGEVKELVKKVKALADGLIAEAKVKPGDKFDVVSQMARLLPIRVVAQYFGIPSGKSAVEFTLSSDAEANLFYPGSKLADLSDAKKKIKPSENQMYIWIANAFRNLFLNLARDPNVAAYGRKSGCQLTWYLYKMVLREIESQKGGTAPAPTMVSRFVAYYLKNGTEPIFGTENPTADPSGKRSLLEGITSGPEHRIACQLAGSVAGAGVTVEEGIARIFNVLLRPANASALAEAAKAAKDADYVNKLKQYAYEALRFEPQAEMLVRVNVGPDSEIEGQKIPFGNLIFASLYAAMHDETVVTNPENFEIGRPENCYLGFGWNRNQCLGKHIATVEMVEAMRAILTVSGDIKLVESLKFSKEAPFEDTDKPEATGAGVGPYARTLMITI